MVNLNGELTLRFKRTEMKISVRHLYAQCSNSFAEWSKAIAKRCTMDFRPRETLFFCDNFLTFGLISFNFRHQPFQLKCRFLSIWFVNEKSKFEVLVVGP